MTNPMHAAVIAGNTTLIATDDSGAAIKGGPRILCEAADWNDGHPVGALLEKDHDFDAVRLTEPMRISGWTVLDSTRRKVGSFVMATALLIEPGTQAKLIRAVLVPRVVFEA